MTDVPGKLKGPQGSADCMVRYSAVGAHTVVLGSVKPSLPIGDYTLTVGNISWPVHFDGRDWGPPSKS